MGVLSVFAANIAFWAGARLAGRQGGAAAACVSLAGGLLLVLRHPGAGVPALLRMALMVCAMALASLADIRTRTVPDALHLVLLAAGCVGNRDFVGSLLTLAGLVALFCLLAAAKVAPLPGGDVKFICACGFCLRIYATVAGVLTACILVMLHMAAVRLVLRKAFAEAVPFVPYLSAGFYVWML